MTVRTVLIAIVVAVCSGLVYGYNIGVYSGAIIEIRTALRLDDGQVGDLIALFEFMEFIGVLLAFLADRYGRRRTMMMAAAVVTLTPLLPLTDPSYAVLLLSRGLTGLAAGYTFTIALVYVAEICEPRITAPMASLVPASISAGYLVELLINAQLVPEHHWRTAIAIGAVPALVQLIGLVFLQESPAYYRLRGDQARAARSLAFYALEASAPPKEAVPARVFAKIGHALATQDLRRQLWRGLVVVLSGAFSGHVMVTHYGPIALEYFGESDPARALEILGLFSLLGLFCSFIALIPIARGYSVALLWGNLAAMGVIQMVLGFVSGATAIALLGVLQLAFSFGLRTTMFQIVARLFSDSIRTVGVAMLNLIFIALGVLVEDVMPQLFTDWGQAVFPVFAALSFVFAFLCWHTLARAKIN